MSTFNPTHRVISWTEFNPDIDLGKGDLVELLDWTSDRVSVPGMFVTAQGEEGFLYGSCLEELTDYQRVLFELGELA
jgi:hypothetical protein